MKIQGPEMNTKTSLLSKTALVVALSAAYLLAPVGAQAQSPDSGLMNLFNNLNAPEEEAPSANETNPKDVQAEQADSTAPSPLESLIATQQRPAQTGSNTTSQEQPVQAQTTPSRGGDSMFGNILRQNTVEQSQAQNSGSEQALNNIEAQINERMQSLVARLASPTRAPASEELTVEDLDTLRREAERAQATLALREAEFQEIEAEIEMLSLLQATLGEIRSTNFSSDTSTQSEEPAIDVQALRAQWEAERAAEERAQATNPKPNENAAAEQQVIPRLASIKGSGGRFEAEIESANGVIQYVTPGDALADGFVVESIDAKGVVIKGQRTNTRYSLIPSPPVVREEQQSNRSFDIPIAQPMGIVN